MATVILERPVDKQLHALTESNLSATTPGPPVAQQVHRVGEREYQSTERTDEAEIQSREDTLAADVPPLNHQGGTLEQLFETAETEAAGSEYFDTIRDVIQVAIDLDEYDSDFSRPNMAASTRALLLVCSAYSQAGRSDFPRGYASTPGDGRLIIEWERDDRFVHAGLRPNSADDYIVYGEEGCATRREDLSSEALTRRLSWLVAAN